MSHFGDLSFEQNKMNEKIRINTPSASQILFLVHLFFKRTAHAIHNWHYKSTHDSWCRSKLSNWL